MKEMLTAYRHYMKMKNDNHCHDKHVSAKQWEQ